MANSNSICKILGCGNPILNSRGWCSRHYQRWQRHGDPEAGGYSRNPSPDRCGVMGCEKRGPYPAGYCSAHYSSFKKYGDPLKAKRPVPQPCLIDGCEHRAMSRGYCQGHATRIRRHGDPSHGGQMVASAPKGELLDWIERHVSYDGEGCLIWPFVRGSNGYGGILFEGKDNRAHRVMCIKAHGRPAEKGLYAAHSCGNGHLGCVHPKHLRWATPSQNMMDRVQHGTHTRGERNWNARLTEENVRMLRSLGDNMSDQKWADAFGIHKHTVRCARIGKTWAWLR